MEIVFTHKVYLLFLFLIPVLIFLYFYSLKNLKGKALKFANYEAISRVSGIDLYSKNIWDLVLNVILVLLLVFALSGLTIYKEMNASDFSYVLAIDSSGSMSAKDMSPDRLGVAKETAIYFVNSLPYESYTGVISFSGNSKTMSLMTKDKLQLKQAIESISINEVGGTDIHEAILNSIKMLKKEKNKAIILLSDGQINVGNFDEIVDSAVEGDVLVHTIGIGSVEGGEVSYGFSKLDEDSLKSLSYNTGGKYFNAKNTEEMKSSFDEIILVTKKTGEIELSSYLLIIVLILFMVKSFLINTNRIVI